MSCTTTYLLVEPDGSIRVAIEKYGQVHFSSAAELLAHLDGAGPVQPGEQVWVACRGWFIDRARRYARFYECNLQAPDRLASEREFRARPGWAGWDVGVAWEQRFEVAELAGVRCEEADDPSFLDGWDGCVAAGHLGCHIDRHRFPHRWNPVTKELRYTWYWDDGVDLSVIDATGEVRDHHFTEAGLLTILGRGPALLEELATVTPGPEAMSSREGALIDAQRHTVHYWLDDGLGPATRAELRRRWPGWTIAREPAGHAGRLQRTGRTEEDLPMPWPAEERALSYIRAVEVDPEEVEPPPLPDEEARLVDAVHAAPEEDAPRLAYARYLTERGDRRGEFIAVQCELAALERAGTWSPRRRRLEAEDSRLKWCAVAPPGTYPVFRRGFPAEVHESSVQRLKERLVAPTIDAVRLLGPLTEDEARALVALPAFERLRSIEVKPAGGLRILAEAGARLRTLTVAGDLEGNEVADVLAAPGPLAGLERLTLSGDRWSPKAPSRVLQEMRLPALRGLNLYEVHIDEALLRDLTLPESLVSLALPLNRDAAHALGHSQLVSLEVAPIGARVLEAVVDGSFPALRHLGVSYCALDYSGLVHCLKSPLFRQLTSLRLDGVALSTQGWWLLARHPALDGLMDLRIGQRGPVDPDAVAAVRARFGDGVTVR